MPRRSKEDALATRHRLLDAAEHMFQAKGVSGTSLADIAAQAGATRGAIYWHFEDKADLFNAMMERVTLPLENALHEASGVGDPKPDPDPVPMLRKAILAVFKKTAGDARTRRVFQVATHMVEYVDSNGAIRQRHLAVRDRCVREMKVAFQRSAKARGQRLHLPAEVAARGLHALVDGLIGNWLLQPAAFDLLACGQRAVDVYLSGLWPDPKDRP